MNKPVKKTNKLLPCPFCGLTPEINSPDFCYPMRKKQDAPQLWVAGCSEDRGGCTASVLGYSKEHAISEWQNRKDGYIKRLWQSEFVMLSIHFLFVVLTSLLAVWLLGGLS